MENEKENTEGKYYFEEILDSFMRNKHVPPRYDHSEGFIVYSHSHTEVRFGGLKISFPICSPGWGDLKNIYIYYQQ